MVLECMEIREKYLYELGKCKHYELKCNKYGDNRDPDKYKKYYPKYQYHKMMAGKYYNMMREQSIYSDFMEDESIFSDSDYFTTDSTIENLE